MAWERAGRGRRPGGTSGPASGCELEKTKRGEGDGGGKEGKERGFRVEVEVEVEMPRKVEMVVRRDGRARVRRSPASRPSALFFNSAAEWKHPLGPCSTQLPSARPVPEMEGAELYHCASFSRASHPCCTTKQEARLPISLFQLSTVIAVYGQARIAARSWRTRVAVGVMAVVRDIGKRGAHMLNATEGKSLPLSV